MQKMLTVLGLYYIVCIGALPSVRPHQALTSSSYLPEVFPGAERWGVVSGHTVLPLQ